MVKRTALITGGARRLGKAIAEELSEMGFNIIIHYNNSEEEAVALRDQLSSKEIKVFLVKADLLVNEDDVSYTRMYKDIWEQY